MARNPILDFEVDKSSIQYAGHDLARPECILAEPDGVLWAADARGGVTRIRSRWDPATDYAEAVGAF